MDPSDECEEFESTFSDDDEFPIGPERADDQEPIPEEEDRDVDITGEDFDELIRTLHRRRRRPLRRNRFDMENFTCRLLLPAWCAIAAMKVEAEHFETADLQMLQQVAGPEPGKTVVPPGEVRQAVGRDLDAWILAAQAEHDSFFTKEAAQEATIQDIKDYGKRLLPMVNVWSRTSEDHRKCRSCIAGNFQQIDPAAQCWTAQAEPSSIFAAAKIAAVRKWEVSKLDVKGAFLNAPIPAH